MLMISKLYWDICVQMNEFRSKSNAWKEMALEIIELSKSNLSLNDFKKFCLLQEKTIEKSYDDRMDILSYFLDNKIILLHEKKLYLGKLTKDGELYNLYITGDSFAWQLVSDIFPETHKEILFDDTLLKEIGAKGETFVVGQLKSKLPKEYHQKIDQASKRDDTVGYDIASPSIKGFHKEMYLEVKTTNNPRGDFTFYISSNEYKISQKNYGKWYLVLVRIIDNIPHLVGHITSEVLSDKMPKNCNERVSWKSAKIRTDNIWIKDGLP